MEISVVKASKNLILCFSQLLLGYVCVDVMMAVNLHYLALYTDKITTAAFGISWMIIQMFIIPPCIGINQLLNSSASQALGHQKTKLSLVYYNFTICIHTLAFIPLSILIYICKTPLSYLIYEERELTINRAWEMIIPIMITLFLFVQHECLKTYLISANVFKPFIYIHLITTIIHLVFVPQFIHLFGYMGVCYSAIFSEIICVTLLLFYIKSNQMDLFSQMEYQFLPTKFSSVFIHYLKDSFPFILHIYADYIIFFLLTLLAFGLGLNYTNAQLALGNTSTIFFKIPISLSIALTTFIGQEIGRSNIKNALLYIKTAMSIYFLILLITVTLFYQFKNIWASFYTKDQIIHELLIFTLPYFLFGNVIFDGIQISLTGILKGINKSSVVSNSTLISYYLIGIPLILIFTYICHFQLAGIWSGFGIANLSLCIYYSYRLINMDWNKQYEEIRTKLDTQHSGIQNDLELQVLEDEKIVKMLD